MFTAERDLCHPDAGERRKAVDYVRAVPIWPPQLERQRSSSRRRRS
jgi:hypothetical protein